MPFHFIDRDFFRFLDALGHEPSWEAYRKYYYDPHHAFLDSYWRTFRWMDLEQVRARVEKIKASDYAHLQYLIGSIDLEHAAGTIMADCAGVIEAPEEPEIYFLVGFFSADGFVLEHEGKPVMGFGLERFKDWRLLPVLFAHEYAHYLRHLFLSDEPYLGADSESAERSLVTEGLAIVFSETVFHEYPLRDHLLFSEERLQWCYRNRVQLNGIFDEIIKGGKTPSLLWSGDARLGIPPRIGHYIGYSMIKASLKRHPETSWPELMKWQNLHRPVDDADGSIRGE